MARGAIGVVLLPGEWWYVPRGAKEQDHEASFPLKSWEMALVQVSLLETGEIQYLLAVAISYLFAR